MRKSLVLFFIFYLVLLGGETGAQTSEQDRRIEEEKRENLKPTIATPSIYPEKEAVAEEETPFVPLPIKDIYLVNLIPQRIVYRYDAAKVIVILMGVDDDYIGLDEQITYLQKNGFLPKRFRETFDPMKPLRRGLAAYMFRQALGIKGGIALHLFGPSERYALKELAFQGIMSPGLTDDLVSGAELVQIMSQAANYRVKQEEK